MKDGERLLFSINTLVVSKQKGCLCPNPSPRLFKDLDLNNVSMSSESYRSLKTTAKFEISDKFFFSLYL